MFKTCNLKREEMFKMMKKDRETKCKYAIQMLAFN